MTNAPLSPLPYARASPRKMRWWGWPILAAMLSGLAYWVYCQPFVLLFLLLVGVLAYFQLASEKRARKRLAASRQGETICDFARSFHRQADTWIIRAVYEELARFLAVEGQPLPVRREDRCEKDLKIDPEDLDDLARDIAYRARRSMDHSDKNPVYGEVKTVADMVTFFEHQPKLEGVGSAGGFSLPAHTTWHAGPHQAVPVRLTVAGVELFVLLAVMHLDPLLPDAGHSSFRQPAGIQRALDDAAAGHPPVSPMTAGGFVYLCSDGCPTG